MSSAAINQFDRSLSRDQSSKSKQETIAFERNGDEQEDDKFDKDEKGRK